jgi:hypothetical protein
MAYIGKQPVVGNFQVCDAISVVNGQAAYTMQVGSTNVEPENANHMLVSLNGVLQKPGSSFTISGATITFASNLATGDVIDFIILLGNVLDIGTPSDATVTTAKIVDGAVTSAKMFSGFANGITEVDFFFLPSDITSNGILTSLTRATTGFDKIGTGMTQSSGVFTFPSTGLYEIRFQGEMDSTDGDSFFAIAIFATIDNSNYIQYTRARGGSTDSGGDTRLTTSCSILFDVTNTSTHKVKFDLDSLASGTLIGGSAPLYKTNVIFKRLGDT